VNYEPTSLGADEREATPSERGYQTFPAPVNGPKVRVRSQSFADHNRQARLFWNSMSVPEQQHLVQALQFELGKVAATEVKQRMLGLLAMVDRELTEQVAAALGLDAPSRRVPDVGRAAGLSQLDTRRTAATRKVAILAADGLDASDVGAMKESLVAAGLAAEVVAPRLGTVTGSDGREVKVDQRFPDVVSVLTTPSTCPTVPR
jgi:catalase